MPKRSVCYMHIDSTSFKVKDSVPGMKDDMPSGNISISVEQSRSYEPAIADDIIDSNCERRYSYLPINTDGTYSDTIVYDSFDSLRVGFKNMVDTISSFDGTSSVSLTVHNTNFNDAEKELLSKDANEMGCNYCETDVVYQHSGSKSLDSYDQLHSMIAKSAFDKSDDSVQNSEPNII